ncbi:MAG: OadG family protein [Bacteroidales bacterium]|nr:OadG family protein [Bacteroidales bacterium]HOO65590.1 OadG family transporter subunit [Bacteroidales bacterium]HPE23807.1 OadG family transporter subunit [Bacteroidales bacterium]HPJ04183.1 OadG family transporter subunit [Bacteroidales bacterium]HPQ62849.1 OadG family transporter subunit [Bacteroidales bacterium]
MHSLLLAGAAESLDPLAWTIVVVGVGIVFLSLLVVYIFFRYILTFILNFKLKSFARKKGIDPAEALTAKTIQSGEVNAAIAMALYQYFNELHDVESGVITIKRISRHYSPWSSKLYNMNNL